MRLLITGGAGFIGSNLARLAVSQGVDVVVLDDLSTGAKDNLGDLPVAFVEASLLDPDAVQQAVDGVDSVAHLAALPSVPRSIADPLASHAANATGTLVLLEQARAAGVRHVLSASSSSVYGMNPALPKSEREWVRPMSPYAVSKLATEQYTLAYQQSYGLQTVAFRFFNVYGPGQAAGHAYAAAIPAFVDALLDGRPLTVYGDGTQSRDFTFVGTVCRVLLDCALRRLSHPEPVNLAFGTNTSLNDLIAVLESVTGRSAARRHEAPRPGDVAHSQAANEVLRGLFPDVTPVPLRAGLAETVAWFEATR
ncbi:MAG TPA: NAD-dependent epimerase/dehydratase family protein [Dermatophilaceae bacterium]|nr:NAD-dependent epimerase/dehydratase family protein [Dermatophilaceae bacterium]